MFNKIQEILMLSYSTGRPHVEWHGFNEDHGNGFLSMGSGRELRQFHPSASRLPLPFSVSRGSMHRGHKESVQPHPLAEKLTETFISSLCHFLKQLVKPGAPESLGWVPGIFFNEIES